MIQSLLTAAHNIWSSPPPHTPYTGTTGLHKRFWGRGMPKLALSTTHHKRASSTERETNFRKPKCLQDMFSSSSISMFCCNLENAGNEGKRSETEALDFQEGQVFPIPQLLPQGCLNPSPWPSPIPPSPHDDQLLSVSPQSVVGG